MTEETDAQIHKVLIRVAQHVQQAGGAVNYTIAASHQVARIIATYAWE